MKVVVTTQRVHTINPTHENIVIDLAKQRTFGQINEATYSAELLDCLDIISENVVALDAHVTVLLDPKG